MMSMFVPTELTPLRTKIGEGVSYTVQKTVGFWEEFADFLGRSSVAELAIGIVIGTAFQVLINSLMSDILLPPTLGVILGANFVNLFYLLKSGKNGPSYATVSDAQSDGAITINYGRFLQLLVSFLAVVVMLFIIVKILQEVHNHVSWRRKWQECPFCCTRISSRAVRCPFCTSHIPPTPPEAPQVSTYGLDVDRHSVSFDPREREGGGGGGGLGVADHHYRLRGKQAHNGKQNKLPAAPIPDFETYTRSADPIGLGAPIGHGQGVMLM